MSTNGNIQVRYDYDVFGKITAVKNGSNQAITDTSSLAFLNPLRYRGYYLDTETGLYYLMSRYYDPVVHRFINSDGYFQSGGNILDANMSAYCGNNPVMFFDLFGERYISSTTVRNEDKNEKFISCRYQSFASLKKYNPAPIGTYSGGDIYFVSSEDRNPTTWNTDVVIRDFRNSEHNVRIINSCLITNPEDMYTILNCLSEYEKQNPSKWERDSDVDDMYTEWDAHNWSFKYIGCFNSAVCKRAQSVDIDNKDANKSFWDHTFGRFLNERFG